MEGLSGHGRGLRRPSLSSSFPATTALARNLTLLPDPRADNRNTRLLVGLQQLTLDNRLAIDSTHTREVSPSRPSPPTMSTSFFNDVAFATPIPDPVTGKLDPNDPAVKARAYSVLACER